MDFVTVARFSNSFDMHVIKFRLENEGIECFVRDEHTVTANPLFYIPMGGIRLQVMEKDVEAALKVLKEADYSINDYSPNNTITQKTIRRYFVPLVLIIVLVFLLILQII